MSKATPTEKTTTLVESWGTPWQRITTQVINESLAETLDENFNQSTTDTNATETEHDDQQNKPEE